MKSSQVAVGNTILAKHYNDLREDAKGSGFLLAHEQTTPNMTLFVESGVYYIGTTRVAFAGGNSPAFTAPITNPRVDILTIDSAGVLAITQGTEAASPTAPAYPADKIVICEVHNRVGETTIRDVDTAGQGFILRDTRPFVNPVFISAAAQIASGIIADSHIAAGAAIGLDKTADSATRAALTNAAQTITGIKTFGSIPVLPASDPTAANEAARKAYVDLISSTSVTKKLAIVTTDVTVANTTVETNLLSVSVPAGRLSTNNGIRVQLFISGLQDALTSQITFRFKYGATTLVTLANTFTNATLSKGYIYALLLAAGATNSQEGSLGYDLQGGASIISYGGGTAVEDSTTALNLVISAQWDVANIGNVVTMSHAVIESIAS